MPKRRKLKSREPRWTVVEMEMGWKSGREHRPVLKVEFGDCAANAMHGSIAPTRVLISLEFDSHLSGVNQDKISTKKFKTAHNGIPPFSARKGREGGLFFLLSFFRLSLLIRPIPHTSRPGQHAGIWRAENSTQTYCVPTRLPRMRVIQADEEECLPRLPRALCKPECET